MSAPVLDLRRPGLPDDAPVIERLAAKGVLVRGGRLLLLRSRHGDLKLPGGGVEPGETPERAVVRELGEECGLDAAEVGPLLLTVVDARPAHEPGAVFRMTVLHYAVTSAAEPSGPRDLEGYEADLALEPEWARPDDALAANRAVLAAHPTDWLDATLWWVPREIAVVERLRADGHL
ncbi:NUDIX domain-containing protein [Kineosporia sp. R_H_3]|uniref:NUDIX domain-containing protein n=1 Tax=Kineosporia sp. R_H_3 TaxID=1961848 RepID=UPI00117B3BE3|nr:NUDIX domain-containing protein [Kineosporia sp. R_H_3]